MKLSKQDRLKKHIKNVLLYMTSTSVLLASCDVGYYADELLSSDEHFAANEEEGLELLPIDIYVDAQTKLKMATVGRFAQDVASQSGSIISEMNNNPQAVLDRYGLSEFRLDRNSLEVQAIMALGDPEVQESLQNGDFRKYIQILNEKGLLQSDRVEQITKILQNPENAVMARDADACFFVLPVVMVAAFAVAVAVWAGIVTKSGIYGASVQNIGAPSASMEVNHSIDNLMNDNAMRLWIYNHKTPIAYSLSDADFNSIVDIVLSAFEHAQLSDVEKEKIVQLCIGTYKHLH